MEDGHWQGSIPFTYNKAMMMIVMVVVIMIWYDDDDDDYRDSDSDK